VCACVFVCFGIISISSCQNIEITKTQKQRQLEEAVSAADGVDELRNCHD